MDFCKSHLSPLLIGNQESNSLSAVTSPVLPSAAVNNIRVSDLLSNLPDVFGKSH